MDVSLQPSRMLHPVGRRVSDVRDVVPFAQL